MPLYAPFKAVENYIRQSHAYTNPFEIKGATFSFHCAKEDEVRTFELHLTEANSKYFGAMLGDRIAPELFAKDGRLDFEHHFVGACKSCKEYHVDFLLHVYTDKPIPQDQSNTIRFDPDNHTQHPADEYEKERANLYIEKIGAPKTKVIISKAIEKYLDRESCNWFYKSKVALADGLGIGAFAYFRRIIEKELIRMVDDIAALTSADPALSALVAKHRAGTKPHLIYDDIYNYLPKSLQALEANPLKLLYQQTSEGLHNLSEVECLQKAKQIEIVLEFVITKINEEKSTMLEVKNAVKMLRNG